MIEKQEIKRHKVRDTIKEIMLSKDIGGSVRNNKMLKKKAGDEDRQRKIEIDENKKEERGDKLSELDIAGKEKKPKRLCSI